GVMGAVWGRVAGRQRNESSESMLSFSRRTAYCWRYSAEKEDRPLFNALSRRGRRPGKLAVGCESRTDTIPAGFARNTKPQPCRLFAEGAHNYSGGFKMLKNLLGPARANPPEQHSAGGNP